MKKASFWKVFLSLVGSIIPLIFVVTVLADSGRPGTGSISATFNTSTGLLSVSGTYVGAPTGGNKSVGLGLFINGATPSSPGSGSLDGINTNTMHILGTSSSGSWSDDHTLSLESTPSQICAVIYDVDSNKIGQSNGKNDIPAGSNRNTDNSYENNGSYGFMVKDGKLDLNKDGNVNNDDDGSLLGVTIINGEVDINASGSISNSDDGTYNGFTVIDGKIDINVSGSVNNSDDGFFANDPATCTAPAITSNPPQCDEGYHFDEEEEGCVPNENGTPVPTPRTDVCDNIDGIQTSVPDGKHLDASGLNCVEFQFGGPPPPPPATGGQVLGATTLGATGAAEENIFFALFTLGSILAGVGVRKFTSSKVR